ncbi:MAG: YhbY family RNA-binding protein [Candidatus Izemoplasmatales bacterium]|uniref:YhbY family RNA-binding protein n=1 Tax=Hujiaoplasma nucleasis TaxID=2725268 RepID=A0A7L6N340_9MOLU|nr:YhbY family RNA-binding protein [Hujiaoplasma nucleasis]QLY39628.1 YhbY family RNA-binding protein [Hujiaoplasma nucleasis]
MELKGKQKAALRRLANEKDIMFQIGQAGISDQVVQNVLTNLEKHEIGRISVLKNCPDSIDAIIKKLEDHQIMVVYKIGRVLLLYKENKKLKNRIRL